MLFLTEVRPAAQLLAALPGQPCRLAPAGSASPAARRPALSAAWRPLPPCPRPLQDNDFAGDAQKITLDELVEHTKGM